MVNLFFRSLTAATATICLVLAGCGRPGNDTGMARSDSSTSMQGGTSQGSSSGTMSDANILAKLTAGDSSEVEVAKYVLGKTSNSQVKQFAQMLIDDHSKDADQLKNIADQEKITPAPPANDTTQQHADNIMSMIRSAGSGPAMDAAFVQAEVQDHEQDLNEAKDLMSTATSGPLKQHLAQLVPNLQRHLDHAQTLMQSLGTSQTGRDQSGNGMQDTSQSGGYK